MNSIHDHIQRHGKELLKNFQEKYGNKQVIHLFFLYIKIEESWETMKTFLPYQERSDNCITFYNDPYEFMNKLVESRAQHIDFSFWLPGIISDESYRAYQAFPKNIYRISNRTNTKTGLVESIFFQEENIKANKMAEHLLLSLGTIALSFNEIDWNMILDKKKKRIRYHALRDVLTRYILFELTHG